VKSLVTVLDGEHAKNIKGGYGVPQQLKTTPVWCDPDIP
jgi:hypothetical protein